MGKSTAKRDDRRGTKRAGTRAAFGLAVLLALGVVAAMAPAARAAGPCAETAYANGQEYCLFIARIVANPSPGLLATAEPIYIAAYSPLPAGCDTTNPSTCGPEALPSGYMPLCNPCFHGGALNAFPYHDHIMEGAPGFGNQGTADAMKGPWILIVVAYDPTYSNQVGFTPYKSTSDLRAGEAAGHFVTLNSGAANPYEINTGVVLIFGVQPLS
jgi:hypothetical protein